MDEDLSIAVRGLYGIADSSVSAGDPLATARAMLAGGCRLVQLRCKGLDRAQVLALARPLRALTARAGAALVVNDDPSLAAEVGADGLHLGQLDGPLLDARAVFDGWIGRSTHDLHQLAGAVAEGADYVAFGPVYATPNLSRAKEVRGLERLARARSVLPRSIPLVAIGGITAARLPEVRAAGADAWAVIGAIATASDPEAATRALL